MNSTEIRVTRAKLIISQLCVAVKKGDEARMEKWLALLKEINQLLLLHSEQCDKLGDNVLHYASLNKNETLIKRLLKIPVLNINEKSLYGQTAFHFAASNENRKVMRALLRCPHRNVNAQDENGYNALHFAVFFERSGNVEMLLKSPEIDMNALSNEGSTPLDLLVQQRDKRPGFDADRVIYRLLKKAGAKTARQLHLSTQKNSTTERSINNVTHYDYDQIAFFGNRSQKNQFISNELLLPHSRNISAISDNSSALMTLSPRLYVVSGLFFIAALLSLLAFMTRYCRHGFFTRRQEKRVEAIELPVLAGATSALLP
jgi:hypothetical protein